MSVWGIWAALLSSHNPGTRTRAKNPRTRPRRPLLPSFTFFYFLSSSFVLIRAATVEGPFIPEPEHETPTCNTCMYNNNRNMSPALSLEHDSISQQPFYLLSPDLEVSSPFVSQSTKLLFFSPTSFCLSSPPQLDFLFQRTRVYGLWSMVYFHDFPIGMYLYLYIQDLDIPLFPSKLLDIVIPFPSKKDKAHISRLVFELWNPPPDAHSEWQMLSSLLSL
jgi:hypothetical protein